jgi:hypothetical protein
MHLMLKDTDQVNIETDVNKIILHLIHPKRKMMIGRS